MANVICLIANPTATAYSNVNAALDDIAPYTAGSVQTNPSGLVTLSDAEMATFAAAHPSAGIIIFSSVAPNAASKEVSRLAAKILHLGRLPGTVADG